MSIVHARTSRSRLWIVLGATVALGSACAVNDEMGTGDAARDGALRGDASSGDAHADARVDARADVAADARPDAVACGCGPIEVCGDGLDNNCNGHVDENCPCLPGTTQRCLNGTPQPNVPYCAYGQQSCVGTGELGVWGECSGEGTMADASTSEYACRRIVVLGAPGQNPSSDFQAWLQAHGAIVTRTQTTASDGPLRRALLDTFDVAIIDWLQRDYTVTESNVLRDWVAAGGGLISLCGHASETDAHRQISLLQSVGITYDDSTAYDGPAIMDPSPISYAAGSSRLLSPVTFIGGVRVIQTAAFTGVSQRVAHLSNGITAGMIGDLQTPDEPHRGRMFIWGDEWIEFNSEWSTMADIERLWFNAIEWVNPIPTLAPAHCE